MRKKLILAAALGLCPPSSSWSQTPKLNDDQRSHFLALARRIESAVRKAGYKNNYSLDGETFFYSRLWGCRDGSGAAQFKLMLLGAGARGCQTAFSFDVTTRLAPGGRRDIHELRLGRVFIERGGTGDDAAVKCVLFGLCVPSGPSRGAGEVQRAGPDFDVSPETGEIVYHQEDIEQVQEALDFWLRTPEYAVP